MNEQPSLGFDHAPAPATGNLLALTLDEDAWFTFLGAEWLPLQGGTSLLLGRGKPIIRDGVTSEHKIVAWFDPQMLPNIRVDVCAGGRWTKTQLSRIGVNVDMVSWPGTLPLAAVRCFSVGTDDYAEHLRALTYNFSNITLPDAPIDIVHDQRIRSVSDELPKTTRRLDPPRAWDAIRGSAAMACWGLPGMLPWGELLCESLTSVPSRSPRKKLADIAASLGAPWLKILPWVPAITHVGKQDAGSDEALWHAIVATLSSMPPYGGWQPRPALDAVCEAAVSSIGSDATNALRKDVLELLSDRQNIDITEARIRPVALILKLVLLRPQPERYVTWHETLAAAPPAIWWSGLCLSGLIAGYANLPTKFRGRREARLRLASAAWAATGDRKDATIWPQTPSGLLNCTINQGQIEIRQGNVIVVARPQSARSRWLMADLQDATVREAARAMIETAGSRARETLLLQHVTWTDGVAMLEGGLIPSRAKVGVRPIMPNGRPVTLALPAGAVIRREIDAARFRRWLTSGAIDHPLPEPPASETTALRPAAWDLVGSHAKNAIKAPAPATITHDMHGVPGLTLMTSFVSEREEDDLIARIDAASWMNDLKRRVQHYGWRYDYKTGRIDPNSYLGPLPDWAQELGERLLTTGLLTEVPDQVIVNEYTQGQGISPHIDCPSCFIGPIVTISLCETWEMVFHGPSANSDAIIVALPQRSVAIMDGAARATWKHEIRGRKTNTDRSVRHRRVSLTFRKVKVERPGRSISITDDQSTR